MFAEAFASFDADDEDRELQIQAFLIATLPLAVQILQEYGKSLESGVVRHGPSSTAGSRTIAGTRKKGGKVIRVDFSRKQKR